MAWRFKASKYKNAAPIVPKPEACVRDVCVGSYQTFGNNICASSAFMAFNWEHVGSSLAVLPLDDCGRKSKTMPLLHAHSDTITDMEFSPFHDGLLATGSQDSLVKIWHIPPEGLKESLSTAECTLSQKQRRVENVGFHPVADGLLHVASGYELGLWDLTTQQEAFSTKEHTDVIQSTSWKKDGRLLATQCKDKKLRVLDPRATASVVCSAASHQNIKDSRVVWLGDKDWILTTGFDSARLRQVMIRDCRNLSSPVRTLELDCSTGVLMPLYDADTGMLFLAGKGDTTILYMEVTERDPYLVEGLRHSGEQTKGACLVPKLALRVMEGEVNRVLQLTSLSVIPIMYQVPRKSYREYHADLYPDTSGRVTYVSAPMWLRSHDAPVPTISLHPDAANGTQVHRGNLQKVVKEILAMKSKDDNKLTVNTPIIENVSPKKDHSPLTENKNEDRIDFVNVKDLIKGMEKPKSKPVQEVKPIEKTIDIKETNGNENENEKYNGKHENNGNTEFEKEKREVEIKEQPLSRSNSYLNGVQPPKPLPRSSISDVSSGEGDTLVADVPKPKPRTTQPPISGYKPRLGPKPFSASQGSEEFSFDKVFSVPAVPGGKGDTLPSPTPASEAPPMKNGTAITSQTEKSSPGEPDLNIKDNVHVNGKHEQCADEDATVTDGYRPKTSSTAERRKMFEAPSTDVSIAERRRAYEMRSCSATVESEVPVSPAPLRRRDSLKSRKSPEKEDKRSSVPNVNTKRTSTVFGRVSKFRHLKGTPAHKSTHIENIKNISRQVSGECNGFYANGVRCALPVGGCGGGRVAILELPTGATPVSVAPPPHPSSQHPAALLHPAPLQDWCWDPFRHDRLLVACDDGAVREWFVPETGLTESTNEPARCFSAHQDKIYMMRFHPFASDILATAAHDLTIKIWDLQPTEPVAAIVLSGHTDQIFSMEWSPCGEYLATVCKDSLIRIFKPRASTTAVRTGKGPVGGRGARVVWAVGGTHLVVTGFDKVSERQISVYDAATLTSLCCVGLDVSPAILQIHVDRDSDTLFLTGRGDSTIYCYEVTPEAPYLCALSHHRCPSLHQGIAFLHKNLAAVDKVEFARALRLTNGNVEPLSFTVPRIKSELFQDDLFPPTLVTWEPWLAGGAWLAGRAAATRTASLQPAGMPCLSAHSTPPQTRAAPAQREAKTSPAPLDHKQLQNNIIKSMGARVEMNLKLEQDQVLGDEDWE